MILFSSAVINVRLLKVEPGGYLDCVALFIKALFERRSLYSFSLIPAQISLDRKKDATPLTRIPPVLGSLQWQRLFYQKQSFRDFPALLHQHSSKYHLLELAAVQILLLNSSKYIYHNFLLAFYSTEVFFILEFQSLLSYHIIYVVITIAFKIVQSHRSNISNECSTDFSKRVISFKASYN